MRTLGPWIGLAVGVACSNGKDPTAELPYCEDEATPSTLEEVSPLGFSGSDILAFAAGTSEATFVWERREVADTTLSLAIAEIDGARFVRSTAVYPEDGEYAAIDVICDDRLEIDVSVDVETADGAFDESWQGILVALDADAASTSQVLDPDALGGSYDMDADIDVPDYDDRSLWVEIQLTGEGTRGEVRGQVSGEDDCDGGDCAAWASEIAIGFWGGEQ